MCIHCALITFPPTPSPPLTLLWPSVHLPHNFGFLNVIHWLWLTFSICMWMRDHLVGHDQLTRDQTPKEQWLSSSQQPWTATDSSCEWILVCSVTAVRCPLFVPTYRGFCVGYRVKSAICYRISRHRTYCFKKKKSANVYFGFPDVLREWFSKCLNDMSANGNNSTASSHKTDSSETRRVTLRHLNGRKRRSV